MNRIPIRSGFNYHESIHNEQLWDIMWLDFKLGNNHCCYQNVENKYCNALHNNHNLMLCPKHKNIIYKGNGYCNLKIAGHWCNIKVADKNTQYCWRHDKYNNYHTCTHIFKSGLLKGTVCQTLTMDSYCNKHIKKNKTIASDTVIPLIHTILEQPIPCVYIYRRGDTKGTVCGLLNCQKHGIKKKSSIM